MSFAVAPSYTREASLGLGGMATGLYRLDRTDSLMPPSDFNVMGNISIRGFGVIGVQGNNNFPGRRHRVAYSVTFTNQPLDFWGISYAATSRNSKINYTRRQFLTDAKYTYEALKHFYVGGGLSLNYSYIHKIDDITYLEGQSRSSVNAGVGAILQYDSRDFLLRATRGVNLMLRGTVFPKWSGDSDALLYRVTFTANYYRRLWKGAVLAGDLYGQFNSSDSPWAMKELLGGNIRMRGYYAGRYIDNNIVSFQGELRQNIYKRIGVAAWGGCGTVFPTFSEFRDSRLLPTYGGGLRIEIKRNVNLRVEYGFGRNTSGFVIGVGEAF